MRRAAWVLAALLALPAAADTLRVATFNTELARDGPGVLLRDISKGEAQVEAVVAVIAHAAPDVIALQGIDWDHEGVALAALADRLVGAGVEYPHRLALQPNSGMAADLDMDGDGSPRGWGDAQGFGKFTGHDGIAVLSRLPILADEVRDLSSLLWRDLPEALLPTHPDGAPFPSAEALDIQRLSSTGHWIVPIALPDGERFALLTFQAGPPVFDGPEDRNGRRNHDEIVLWQHVLDGAFGPLPDRFVMAGGANLDPQDADGRHEAIRALLADPRVQDPKPESPGGAPSATSSLPMVPSSTASNSIVALSVSISARMSPARTVSPSLTSQRARVPSSIVGDRAGMRISVAIRTPPRSHRYRSRARPDPVPGFRGQTRRRR